MKKKIEQLILIDGSGYIFRAYYMLPPMNRPDGTPINAVYGFSNMMMKLIDDLNIRDGNKLIAIILDSGRVTFRNDIYPDYKANRDETPEDLIPQFDLIREATKAFNLPTDEMQGFEADDLIATYCKISTEQGIPVRIISADKDLMQLVNNNVEMFDPMKEKIIGPNEVKDKFGVSPEKVIDVQALAGDSVDNIPGVPGIGIKTAAQLIEEYGSLESLLEKAQNIKQPKRRENLINNIELAHISKKLVTLEKNVPVKKKLSDFVWMEPEKENLVEWLTHQGFKSILAKISNKPKSVSAIANSDFNNIDVNQSAPSENKTTYSIVNDISKLNDLVLACSQSREITIDTETSSLNAHDCDLIGISISTEPRKAFYIPIGHTNFSKNDKNVNENNINEESGLPKQLPLTKVLNSLKSTLENPSILKIGQNIKFDMHVLRRYGVTIFPIDDTMILSYVIDGSKHGHGMDELAKLHLNYSTIKFSDICGTGKKQITFDKVELDTAANYAAEDADITLQLYHHLKPRLVTNKVTKVYERLERPLIPILEKMEAIGIKVDSKLLTNLEKEFSDRANVFSKEIYQLAGKEFNIGSPQQLGQILFDKKDGMGLEGKKTKTGAWATGAQVLEDLSDEGHALPSKVLEWRALTKLKSTYTSSLKEQINATTGRIHTTFVQHFTSTGRLSSNAPNLQNIPIRTNDGKKIRSAFIAEEGHILISADYSQIELKILAHVAKEKNLQKAFLNNEDIHTSTAAAIFNLPLEEIDDAKRRKAKTINFGIIYGISPFGLAKQLSISREEAKRFIDTYFNKFPAILNYMEETKNFTKKNGFVITPFGRKCQIPGIFNQNTNIKNYAERAAINAPIQGGAADIIKAAMIRLPHQLSKAGLKTKMILQVHDELIFEAPKEEFKQSQSIIKEVMENTVRLDIPLNIEIGYGKNWAEAH
ncbi:MAG: DNA polymerase I [Pseudomonadota bacterium]|nr:DNA polymerase I [Pseudomonadota bacterium]